MIIMWAFAGLIAIALFGVGGLSDPDSVWGALSNQLLGPGLVGLMLAGVLAGTMSTLAAKALAISSLFVRNVYRQIWPDISQEQGVFYARCTIVVVLVLGTVAATLTTISFVPQVWLTLRTRNVAGISLGMYAAFTAGVALWLVYGIACSKMSFSVSRLSIIRRSLISRRRILLWPGKRMVL